MGEDQIFYRINKLLADAGYDKEICSIGELNRFLNSRNDTDTKLYNEISELYDILRFGPGMW